MASFPTSPISSSPVDEKGLGSSGDDSKYPKFRILIVGRSGTGKSSLINAIFKASLTHSEAAAADVNKEITSEHNKHLVIHESGGYEPENWEKFNTLKKFIEERSEQQCGCWEKLHAIWLCITAPSSGGPTVEAWDEKIFKLIPHKVPIIVVYTKFDLVSSLDKGSVWKGEEGKTFIERNYEEKYGQVNERSMKDDAPRQIPYTIVTICQPETLQRLVKITRENMQSLHGKMIPSPFLNFHVELPDSSAIDSDRTSEEEDPSDSAQVALATAQRIDMAAKTAASIKQGKKKYWRAIASGLHFLGLSLRKCLFAMHKDIVTVWNIPNLEEYLLSRGFCERMMAIVDDLSHPIQNAKQCKIPKLGVKRLAIAWANNIYKRVPEHIRCLMGYVVDLTLILQALFQVSLENGHEKEITPDRVNDIIYEFHSSDKKRRIHEAIWAFDRSLSLKDNVADKIESLIKANEMTTKDIQLDRRPLQSLLKVLRFEMITNGLIPKETILVGKLLDSPDYSAIASELKIDSDIQLLLEYILYLLCNNSLLDSGIQDANKKARTLMFKLTSAKCVVPSSIYITDVTTENDSRSIAIGGLGRTFRGKQNGVQVALKVFGRDSKEGSFRKVQGVLAWRTLTHRHILPLLGVFELKPQLFLVSPYRENGTLTQWRKTQGPAIDEIQKMIREVAEGVKYIHSEGLVHCDLRGENVFLDPDLHCQITDTGLTKYTDAIITLSGSNYQFNYAAPELFSAQSESDGSHGNNDTQGGHKTMETDVYAFGCLYYAIFFDTVPFKGKYEYQIMRLLASGGRPDRLESTIVDDETWSLMQECWKTDPSERPTMERIAERLEQRLSTGKGL